MPASTASVAAPLGGWNARDSLAEMSPMDAVQLTNFFPTPSDVTLRKGYSKYSTGITGQVNTLMNYSAPTKQELFAIAGTTLYLADGAPAVSKVTGLSNDKWQHTNISTPGGHFLVACNGVDLPIIYDGTNWMKMASTTTAQTISTITHVGTTATLTTASAHGLVTGNSITITGASPSAYNGTFVVTVTGTTTFTYTMATTPGTDATVVGSYTVNYGVSGVDPKTFVHVNLFKNQLYFVQVNSMLAWYLPTFSLGGTAQKLDFGSVAKNGGYIQAMGTWTIDAGQGADDYAVWVTNMGEVIVYNGTDPSSPTTWALKGVWQFGFVFARRCFYKFAGDLLMLSQDGLVPLASALQSSRLDPRVNLTDKIYYAISLAADNYSTNFGWQAIYFAKPNMLILNIPITGGTQQYVMHTITKSWANFTGIGANCFELHEDNLYFGGNGFVGQFWTENSDNGANINGYAQQAYSYFDSRGQQKRFTMVRPILLTSGGVPTVACGINVDFDVQNQLGAVTFNPLGTAGAWDTATWDTSLWGSGALVVNKQWQGVTGIGYSGGIAISVASQGIDVHWASSDFVMERGGVL